jgi:hypothetical protein
VIPTNTTSGPFLLRTIAGRYDACVRVGSSLMSAAKRPTLMGTLLAVLGMIPVAAAIGAVLAVIAVLTGHAEGAIAFAATGFPTASSATAVTTLADLYKKSNTDVKTAIKLITEEQKWFRSYPKEAIDVSGNENRVPLILTKPILPSFIADGGNERIMSTPAPTHGTFMPVQMNVRHGYTGLAQALTNRARSAMIEDQTTYQANMSGYSIGMGIGRSTYGTSVGTLAVVRTTGGASATQVIPMKNAYGSATFCAGADGGIQDTYLSSLIPTGNRIALVRSSAIVEFGTVTASPSATSGIGYIDVTFTSSITPTAGDLIVSANADGDVTLTGTDFNQWPEGWTSILLSDSCQGQTTTSFANWAAGSTSTASQRLTFVVKEKMINDCWNAAGVTINRFIMPQGVRRDAIAAEQTKRRYDSASTDIEGDLEAGSGEQNFTSQLALPNTLIGWFDKAVGKIELSDNPDEQANKSIFKLDKVQGKSQIAAGYDYFYQRVVASRAACGYAANLTSQ